MEVFLYEFNTAGTIEALTEKEGRKILGYRVQGLNALRNQIFKEAKEANVSPRAWQVQTPVQEVKPDKQFQTTTSPGETTTLKEAQEFFTGQK